MNEPMAGPDTQSGISRTSAPIHIPGPKDVLVLTICAAALGALGEAGLILGARVALDRFTLFNPQGIWMAPLSNLILLIPLTFLAWLVLSRRRVLAYGVAAFICAALAVLEPALVLRDRVHPIALGVLALGIAAQIGRLAMTSTATFTKVARRGTLALCAVIIAVAVTFNGTRAWREYRHGTTLGGAPDGAPNVILLVLDTVRALSLSAYGYERPTSPTLTRLAEQGVRFDRAVATAPWTLPTHVTLFTGRYPYETSAGWSTPLDATHPTLAERLTALGYATGGFAANLRYCSYEFGLDRGFGFYRDYDLSLSEMIRTSTLTLWVAHFIGARLGREVSPGRQWAKGVSGRFLDWQEGVGDRPFFAFLNFYDAHAPYAPPAPYDTLYLGRQPLTRDPGGDTYTPAEVDDLRASYDASIAYLDAQLGELMSELERRGLMKNTLLIVTSDHGEEFNEHGQVNHGNTLYFPALHVPLILVRTGTIPAGIGVGEAVTLRDVPATILRAAGAPDSLMLPGASLDRFWAGDSAPSVPSAILSEVNFAKNLPPSFPISKGDMKSLIDSGLHYIRAGDGKEELYDVLRDPFERTELSARPELSERMRALRDTVAGIRARSVKR